MALDFRSVKSALRTVLKGLDHTYLNELTEFTETNPSAENLARFIYGRMSEKFARLVYRVTVWETDSAAAGYWEEE
jgi:6-pyruvoyltetrahydropterin/6-carboxytetrahydropterin synthase